MMRLPVIASMALGLGFASAVMAGEITMRGHAPLIDGNREAARQAAMESALRDAAFQSGVQIAQRSRLENGALASDMAQITTDQRFKNIRIVNEQVVNGELQLTVRADAEESDACRKQSRYRKGVRIEPTSLREPWEATLGGLHDVDRALPRWLAEKINAPENFRLDIASEKAPSWMPQFRVATEVLHMGPHPHDNQPKDENILEPLARWSGLSSWPGRRFHLRVEIHDELSASLVFSKEYETGGVWNLSNRQLTGFGSEAFLATDYGQTVEKVVDLAVADIQGQLLCQPLMVRILDAKDDRLYLDAGYLSKLNAGDKLRVFTARSESFQLSVPFLSDSGVDAVILQVQPERAVARLPVPAKGYAIQKGDYLVAW